MRVVRSSLSSRATCWLLAQGGGRGTRHRVPPGPEPEECLFATARLTISDIAPGKSQGNREASASRTMAPTSLSSR